MYKAINKRHYVIQISKSQFSREIGYDSKPVIFLLSAHLVSSFVLACLLLSSTIRLGKTIFSIEMLIQYYHLDEVSCGSKVGKLRLRHS